MRLTTTIAVATAATAVALTTTLVGTAPSSSAAVRHTTWAPAASAAITPGVQMYTDGSQCTGNFVFTDADGGVYVGYAAHCAGQGEATDTDGCGQTSVPTGTTVSFRKGGSLLSEGTQVGTGTLAYTSWTTMNARGESDANTCAYNDFALVKVSVGDVAKVNPSIPTWGGPVGINTTGTSAGDRVYSYGNSSLRAGITQLSPKIGISLGDNAADGGWSHPLYTLTPGVPGDSGSAFVDGQGRAVGTLSTLGLLPLPLSNNIGDLSRELAYAQAHSGIPGLQLANGTEQFRGVL
ncbi:hypothetical protein ABFT23_21095 [Nocardioides sp. C4-1]|uniref:hypothetical protein n=1 Tax=Nocardioides sp. C4-1 TaxID=3151851 RepID=UPI00326726F4